MKKKENKKDSVRKMLKMIEGREAAIKTLNKEIDIVRVALDEKDYSVLNRYFTTSIYLL